MSIEHCGVCDAELQLGELVRVTSGGPAHQSCLDHVFVCDSDVPGDELPVRAHCRADGYLIAAIDITSAHQRWSAHTNAISGWMAYEDRVKGESR